ncbi:hypothetical protein [Kamptonema sp. UHCC 0994]|uniref:hypothetical protein n=1 Tax=Kamptonema sp. UHCC 0994 TaxID=3031329 RepID=UPI0023BAB53F|nr:hypothetical protein [Kamptonema sp. UHCC 0994]MDF0556249.1 hypothetical protein [Kamptonema sp. UHCC 0994]
MSFLRARGNIRPKISTMPRPKTEASMQLELYKLAMEKQRIQQELRVLEERKQQLQKRLVVVNNEVVEVGKKTLEFRQGVPDITQPATPKSIADTKKLDTFYLEY